MKSRNALFTGDPGYFISPADPWLQTAHACSYLCRFAYNADALLDYASGRGGDLHKWKLAQVRLILPHSKADAGQYSSSCGSRETSQ